MATTTGFGQRMLDLMARHCPRDTNGDGDCGQASCPYCGFAIPRATIYRRQVEELISALARDYADALSVRQHIAAVAGRSEMHQPLRTLVAIQYAVEGATPARALALIEEMDRIDVIEDLRSLACALAEMEDR